MIDCPRIVIGATESGAGKTSLTLALVAALRRRGTRVQTFKVGPDFLDPSYLAIASGRPCYNLDGWMMGREYVEKLVARAPADADIAVIEGVMGLFDGAEPDSLEGSTAQIAAWLKAPVILVAVVYGMARSLAAFVKGFATFERKVINAGCLDQVLSDLKEPFADRLAGKLRRFAVEIGSCGRSGRRRVGYTQSICRVDLDLIDRQTEHLRNDAETNTKTTYQRRKNHTSHVICNSLSRLRSSRAIHPYSHTLPQLQ